MASTRTAEARYVREGIYLESVGIGIELTRRQRAHLTSKNHLRPLRRYLQSVLSKVPYLEPLYQIELMSGIIRSQLSRKGTLPKFRPQKMWKEAKHMVQLKAILMSHLLC